MSDVGLQTYASPCVQACSLRLSVGIGHFIFVSRHVQHAGFVIIALSSGVYLNLFNYWKAESVFYISREYHLVMVFYAFYSAIFSCSLAMSCSFYSYELL